MSIEQRQPADPAAETPDATATGQGPLAGYVHVFGKIATILDTLAASPVDLDLTQIATRAELNKATTHRLLVTLAHHGYIEEGSQPDSYRLGLHLFRLGIAVQRQLDLRQRALPTMHELAEATEETVALCILRDNEALCIERVEGKNVQLLTTRVGSPLPLYTGAAARVLLASLPDDQVDAILAGELRQLTRYSEINPGRLRQIVAEIRRQGYAISDEDVTRGVVALSAPIRGADDAVIGALSVSGISQRLTRDRMPILIAQVLNAAARISRAMGHSGVGSHR